MAIPTVITDLSATLASNAPAGGDAAFPNIDDYLRAAYGFIRQGDTKAGDVASAASVDLGAVVGRIVDVTGSVTITSFGTVAAGIWRIVRFTGALTLTHNATSLILPGGGNIVTAAGDCLIAVSLGSGNWVVTHYQPAAGYEVVRSDPKFSARGSAILTLASGSTDIVLNTEDFDIGGGYATGTGIFTAPVAGYYMFCGSVDVLITSTTESMSLRLMHNAAIAAMDEKAESGTTDRMFQVSKLLVLAASDTVKLVFSNGSLNSGTAAVSNGRTFFTGHRVP